MKSDDVEARLSELKLRSPDDRLDTRIAAALEAEAADAVVQPFASGRRRVRMLLALAAVMLLTAATVHFGTPTLPESTGSSPAPQVSFPNLQALGVAVGETMPAFTLAASDGERHALADYAGQIVVLSVGKTQCPWWPGALNGMSELRADYARRGVVFLGLDSDTSNSREDVGAFARDHDVLFPILKDNSHWYANRVAAHRTPAMYVVNRDGTLAYRGAFDNREEPDAEATELYVAEVLEAMVAGERITVARSEPQGCPIGGDDTPPEPQLGYIN